MIGAEKKAEKLTPPCAAERNYLQAGGDRYMSQNQKKLTIQPQWCKGCGICAAFCPKGVLKIVKGKAAVQHPENCILCGLCEQRCPDYAIYLEIEEEEAV